MLTIKGQQLPLLAKAKFSPQKVLLYFLFYYPALFALLCPLFSSAHIKWNEGCEMAVFTSILLLISNFLVFYRLRFLYLLLTLVFVYLMVFIETSYFHLYKTSISESTIFILLETNAAETKDYLSMYLDKYILLTGFFLLVPLVLSIYTLVRLLPTHRYLLNLFGLQGNRSTGPYVSSFILLLCMGLLLYWPKLRKRNLVYVVAKSWRKYQREMKAYQYLGGDKFGGKFSNVSSDNREQELYVLVIGESTTRHHMGLYNYYRNNTPLLGAKKAELDVYGNVISPHTTTIESLEKVLTMANFEHPEGAKDGSLLQLMNKAGFKTYWISNQNPLGTYETLVTALSKAALKSHFTSTSSWEFASPYDERLLIPLKQVLTEKEGKQFVVIHLMGTHGSYNNRYPAAFKQFQSKPVTPFQHERAFKDINDYDNAVLYNDYVMNNLIELVKKQNKKSWVLYFSDHGEDVYETINTAEHSRENRTKSMYDIPFLIWRSDKYKQQDSTHVYQTNRSYTTDDLIYTLADMSHVHFAEFDSTKSLVHPSFVERNRRIAKNEIYEIKFASK